MNFIVFLSILHIALFDVLLLSVVVTLNGLKYPQNVYTNGYWVPYPNEITNGGKRMEYILGMELKQRYGSLLDQSYNPNQLIIYSDETNYTDQSAISIGQGIYQNGPTISNLVSKKALPPNQHTYIPISFSCALPNCMQPIPIKMNAGLNDFLFSASNICYVSPKMQNEHRIEYQSVIESFNKKNKTMFDDISTYFGTTINSSTVQYALQYYISSIYEGAALGFTLNSNQLSTMAEIANISITTDFLDPNDYARLLASEMLSNITYYFNDSITQDQQATPIKNRKRLIIYSSKEDTFLALMRMFFKSKLLKPYPSGSAIIMELHTNAPDKYTIIIKCNDKSVAIENHLNVTTKEFSEFVDSYKYKKLANICNAPLYGVSDGAIACASILEVALIIIVTIHLIMLGIDTRKKWRQQKKSKKIQEKAK